MDINQLSGWEWFALTTVLIVLTVLVAHMLPRPVVALALGAWALYALLKRFHNPRQP